MVSLEVFGVVVVVVISFIIQLLISFLYEAVDIVVEVVFVVDGNARPKRVSITPGSMALRFHLYVLDGFDGEDG